MTIVCAKVHSGPPPHWLMYESFSRTPFRITCPSTIEILSPGPATTRLMNVWLDSVGVGTSQARVKKCPDGLSPSSATPQVPWSESAPLGGWKTTMSPTLGWLIIRLARIRCPIFSVGSIDPLGILYGLTTNAWISTAIPIATAMVATSSTRDLARTQRVPIRSGGQ